MSKAKPRGKAPKDKPIMEELKNATGKLFFLNLIFYGLAYAIGVGAFLLGWTDTLTIFSQSTISIFLFGYSTNSFISGMLWQPFTSMFMHGDLAHLAGNCFFLIIYGFYLEDHGFTDRSIYTAFFVSGVGATLLSSVLIPNIFQIGASGAIFGMLGLILGWGTKAELEEKNQIFGAAIIFLIFSSISPGTNFLAHIFGFFIGYGLGFFEIVSPEANQDSNPVD